MITHLWAQHFKSWQDTGAIRMAPLTGLFGANSSGKTAILQLLLMLKQTVESADRSRVLHTGDELTYADLGTFFDIVYGHKMPGSISFALHWQLAKPIRIDDPEGKAGQLLFSIENIGFQATIQGTLKSLVVDQFEYRFEYGGQKYCFGMRRREDKGADMGKAGYELISFGYEPKRARGRPWPLPAPVKCYGFPDQVSAYYQNLGFLSSLVLAFEELFQNVYYLGPLREYPHRSYVWAGEQPQDVGRRGEWAVPALLAARAQGKTVSRGKGRRRQTVDGRVAEWLRDLELVHSFSLQPIAENRKEFELRVQSSPSASEVSVTDVGFGVSQILPVLVLCYYAPEGSTLILEQPEIHLHPAVQAGLADVFIDVIKTRGMQIIVESHSEHLLRRLQRRVAERGLTPEQTALYFTGIRDGRSRLDRLELDLFGNITNWPEHFFGDELGELSAMTEAAMQRRLELVEG
ncbi:MAG: AAA family ATPase [Anaerolineae bacterium]